MLRIHWSCPCLPSENYDAVAPLILCKRLALLLGGGLTGTETKPHMEIPLEAGSSKLFRHVLLKHELVVPEEHVCICRRTKLNGIGNSVFRKCYMDLGVVTYSVFFEFFWEVVGVSHSQRSDSSQLC